MQLSTGSFKQEISFFPHSLLVLLSHMLLMKRGVLALYEFQKAAGLHLKLNLENDRLLQLAVDFNLSLSEHRVSS